jgi:acyl dehydratase
VLVGDPLTLQMHIEAKRMLSTGDRGVVQRRMKLVNQHGKIAQEGIMGLMMWFRGQLPD